MEAISLGSICRQQQFVGSRSGREDTLRPLVAWPRPLSFALSSATVSCAGARLAAGSGAQWLLNTCAKTHTQVVQIAVL